MSRYLSAGKDPVKVSAFDQLHELPIGRHTFRVLSVVWGIGLVVEASARLTLADLLPTGTFLAVSPFITATVIGSLFAFTVVFTRADRARDAGPRRPSPSPAVPPAPTPDGRRRSDPAASSALTGASQPR